MDNSVFMLIVGSGVLALLYALWRSSWISKQDPGNDRMKEIGLAVREGAMAFLAREYKVLAVFVIAVAILLFFGNYSRGAELVALSFIVGAFCSGLAGFFGMRVATLANNRTTQAARTSLNDALMVAFNGGSVMGMALWRFRCRSRFNVSINDSIRICNGRFLNRPFCTCWRWYFYQGSGCWG